MANFLQRVYNGILSTWTQPYTTDSNGYTVDNDVDKNLSNYITRVQLGRMRQDIQSWRDAITEAENAWYPHRVLMQQMYIDTVLHGHTLACINKRKQLSLLRDFSFRNGQVENEKQKKLFQKLWFTQFLEYALEARFFGYSLISLGDMVNDDFPDLSIVRRFNISPDRLQVTRYIYSLVGANFLEEPFKDWHVWVPTPSNVGISKCGYGILYNVALYEIYARNLLGNNATAAELYGMPTRVAKTTKTEEIEREKLFQSLLQMGGAGAVVLDPQDELDLVESKGMGQGYKIFPDLEERLEKKISKIILGHSDAIDSTAGKLGPGQGGEESPAQDALRNTAIADGVFLEHIVNDILIPKLINLGMNINPVDRFVFSNNHELEEARENEDRNNLLTANIAYQMAQAGLKMDAEYFAKRTGIPATEIVNPISSPVKTVKQELNGKAPHPAPVRLGQPGGLS